MTSLLIMIIVLLCLISANIKTLASSQREKAEALRKLTMEVQKVRIKERD